jgi:hypothetical protein
VSPAQVTSRRAAIRHARHEGEEDGFVAVMGVDPAERSVPAIRGKLTTGAAAASRIDIPVRWRSVWARAYDRAACWSVGRWAAKLSEVLS